jgi:hypothetical protein
LGVGNRVSSAGAEAKTISVVEVGIEAGITTAEKIRKAGLIIKVFGRLKVKVVFSGKS